MEIRIQLAMGVTGLLADQSACLLRLYTLNSQTFDGLSDGWRSTVISIDIRNKDVIAIPWLDGQEGGPNQATTNFMFSCIYYQ